VDIQPEDKLGIHTATYCIHLYITAYSASMMLECNSDC